MNLSKSMIKLFRYTRMYGLGRTAFKVFGRLRHPVCLVWRKYPDPDIAVIGCGQFGLSTLGYFLTKRFGRRLRWVYDPDETAADSMRIIAGGLFLAKDPAVAIADPATKYVFIASNHASHTEYAVEALHAGKYVYVEKPVSVSIKQLAKLCAAAELAPNRLAAGYNRPFSAAIRDLQALIGPPLGGLSLSCFVSGHVLDSEHWYRNPKEGTRICGNAGHWIDLFIHLLHWRGKCPKLLRIQLLSADPAEADDNFSLTIGTEQSDVFTLMLTARSEPFEGINETINVQWTSVIAKIDDFRRMTAWRGHRRHKYRYWPKDVGHKSGVMQFFSGNRARQWSEVVISSLVMLRVTDMVRNGETLTELDVPKSLMTISTSVNKELAIPSQDIAELV
ncbi:Gfo/Idh/MocA family oxidoreductase [bacterium]|nr:Gfo/Idh/MocA family oxidoreductase [bacterium]